MVKTILVFFVSLWAFILFVEFVSFTLGRFLCSFFNLLVKLENFLAAPIAFFMHGVAMALAIIFFKGITESTFFMFSYFFLIVILVRTFKYGHYAFKIINESPEVVKEKIGNTMSIRAFLYYQVFKITGEFIGALLGFLLIFYSILNYRDVLHYLDLI